MDNFSYDILSSQRSESTNSALNKVVNKLFSLSNFMIVFKNLFKGWHFVEAYKDFHYAQTTPPLAIKKMVF